jgi:hypothetical protein
MQTLGLTGHFSIPAHLQDTAEHFGIDIEYLGGGRYKTSDINAPVSRRELKQHLEFLHQPIRAVVEDNLPGGSTHTHKNRVYIHQLLRFATKGSVEIPPDTTEELQKETAECHAKTEQAMRDADAWESYLEIGNPQTVQSTIPGSSFSPGAGFSFALDDKTRRLQDHDGQAQQELREQFWALVHKARGESHDGSKQTLVFSTEEFETFCREANALLQAEGNNLGLLIEQVEFEEDVQRHLQNIEQRISELSQSDLFRRVSVAQTTAQNSGEKLENLIRSTSALTPLITSTTLQDVWTRYHFTDRHDSPLAKISKEYAIFLSVMDVYARQPQVTPEQLESIVQEFYPLLAFSGKITDVLKTGLEKSSARHDLSADLETAQAQCAQLRDAFHSASMTGAFLDPDFMDDEYREVLEALEKYSGQGGAAALQFLKAGTGATLEFTEDVINFIRESPRVSAAFVMLAASLYVLNGGGAEEASNAVDYTAYMLGDEGMIAVAVDPTSVSEDSFTQQNWHWDVGPLGPYKHFMFDNAVVGPAQKIMDGIRMGVQWCYTQAGLPINIESSFSAASDKVIQPLADRLFDVNLFQNFSHAAFWMYMASKGFNHGFKGAKRIFDLMAPVTDMAYQAGLDMAEAVKIKKGTNLSKRLLALTKATETPTPVIRYTGTFEPDRPVLKCGKCPLAGQRRCSVLELAKAAQARTALEETLPPSIREADLTLKIGGLKKHFQIGAENLGPVLSALNQFDMVLEHMAAQVGIDQPWYQAFLQERIKAVVHALKDYQTTGEEKALHKALEKNLQDVMAAQIRYSEISPVHDALFGSEPDVKTSKRLRSIANESFGNLKRADRLARNREKIAAADGESLSLGGHIKANATILGTHLWGGMVSGARAVSKTTGAVANKPVVIATTGLTAAAVALDMAGSGNAFTDMVSSGAGGLLSGLTTTTTFLLYNFWEDVLGVHVGSGIALLTAGTISGYAYNRLLKPSASASLENLHVNTGLNLKAMWGNVAHNISAIRDKVVETLENTNSRIGSLLTRQTQQYLLRGNRPHKNCPVKDI